MRAYAYLYLHVWCIYVQAATNITKNIVSISFKNPFLILLKCNTLAESILHDRSRGMRNINILQSDNL